MPVRPFGLFGLILLVVGLAGCRWSPPDPVRLDDDYFPLETGFYVVYDVDEQRYSIGAPPVRRTYQIREVIGPAYADVTGQTAYSIQRYRRSGGEGPWQADSLWSARRTPTEAIRTENGQDYVKLAFPIQESGRWNGNQRNNLGEDTYDIRNPHQPVRVLDTVFDQTVTVVAQDDSTLLTQDKRIETYARRIGLIHKERTQLVYCSATPTCIGQHQIMYGIRQQYFIRQYGQE